MKFRVLGSLEVTDGTANLTPSAARLRAVLALLLLRHNQPISAGKLIQELWGENPPRTALATLQTYVYRLRRIIVPQVYTSAAGYLLSISPDDLDACEFEALVAAGKGALDEGRSEAASELLRQAESLWRGEALDGVILGEILSAHATRLEESRLTSIDLRLEADLRLGRHRVLIGELKELTSSYPLHEGFHAMLMLALYRSGRRSEGLDAYQALRATLVEDLGVEPSPRVQQLHQAMLLSDGSLDLREARAEPPVRLVPVPAQPRPTPTPVRRQRLPAVPQLPPPGPDLVGRDETLTRIRAFLSSPSGGGVVAIAGPAGIGKTAVAVHAAHQAAGKWPDGQLFAPLGDTFHRMGVGQVLSHFLHELGVPADQVPSDTAGKRTAFLRLTAGRRILTVLDGVSCAEQIRWLMPSGPNSCLLVTYRGAGWDPVDADEVQLGTLSVTEGKQLLKTRLGPRAARESGEALTAIAQLCDGLPLALCAAAERMLNDDQLSAQQLAAMLGEPQAALNAISFGEFDVRARLDGSYAQLSSRDMSAFCLLSLLRSLEFTGSRAAGVLGWNVEEAEQSLSRLAQHGLLRRTRRIGTTDVGYGYHRLIRHYAQEWLEQILDDGASRAPKSHSGRRHLALRLLTHDTPALVPSPATATNGERGIVRMPTLRR